MTRTAELRRIARLVDRLAARRGAGDRSRETRRSPYGRARHWVEGDSSSTFLRGLAVGALVGAAIAGSTIWERRHRGRAGPGAG